VNTAHEFFGPDFRYAVVGATTDTAKYGYRVMTHLKSAGLPVVGVNPKYTEIEGIPVFPTLADVPEKPNVAVFVVPPVVGLALLDQVKAVGITKVWFQPGAESDEVRAKVDELGLNGMTDGSCIMVERRRLGIGNDPHPHHA